MTAPPSSPDAIVTPEQRALLLAAAQGWLGTPYVHQASLRGVGADCLGLVRGLWRTLHGVEPAPTPPYTPDWDEHDPAELLQAALHRWLLPVSHIEPADVLLFRMRRGGPAKHLAIATGQGTLIHAHSRHGVIAEAFGPAWRARLVGVFSFPQRME